VQLQCHVPELLTIENAKKAREILEGKIRISSFWAGWSGPAVWDFYDGPLTLGLVPLTFRSARMKELLAASDFAEKIDITDVITHVGFLPENPNDPDYHGVIAALRYLCGYMKAKKQYFLFETGQETPTTLVRAIEDIGTGNLGINFDTANLILYGKANSVDAAEIFGKYVRNLHCKDGEFPTCGEELGNEVPLGQGKAGIAKVLEILWANGYTGHLTIEREISGDEQIKDIVAARDLLENIAKGLGKG
jgi:sugar phosphate isomerase/epimerase